MEVTEKLLVDSVDKWRKWLEVNHKKENEIWLIFKKNEKGEFNINYVESVEEAICFGWIDGISKKINENTKAQRFTPRRRKSHWTELNKERAKRLIKIGKMSEEGFKSLPDLSEDSFVINHSIIEALKKDDMTYKNFTDYSGLYIRVRVSYIQELKQDTPEYKKRLNNFLRNTKEGKMFGNWNDNGKLTGEY